MSALPGRAPTAPFAAARGRWLRRAPAALLALTIACGVVAPFLYTMNHDVSYLLHAAGRLLRGATLYADVPEINPPLIVWLNLPIAWIAQKTGLQDPLVFRLAVLILAGLSVACSSRLLRGVLAPGHWWSWLAVGMFAALLLPRYEFGQREHLALLCSLPYLAEAARRCAGNAAGGIAQASVAALAIVGLALKPHFLAAPLLVEAYAIWRLRRLSTGCVVAAALLLAYAAAAWLFTPDYLDMVRMLAGAYWRYSNGWGAFLSAPYFYATAVLTLLALLMRLQDGQLPAVLGLAIVGFALAAIVQQKGWSYHWIEALGMALLLFGQAVATAMVHCRVHGMPMAQLIVPAIVAVLSLFSLAGAKVDGHRINPYPAILGPLIRELGGGPVIIFSSFQVSYPLVTQPGVGTSSRFPTMTIVPITERSGNRAAVAWIHRSFAQDFYRAPPRLLLLETDPDGRPIVDFIDYFKHDVPQLLHYRPVRRTPRFLVLAAPQR